MASVVRERELEERVATLAARQHGVVTRAQLVEAGLTPGEVRRRLETARIMELHRGVYRIGPLAAPRAAEMAAVLACGGRAFVSHRSATWLWELGPRPGDGAAGAAAAPAAPMGGVRGAIDVRVPANVRVRRPGIQAHRTARLEADDVAVLEGIPLTSPARTLVDLAAVARPRELERAVARAERRGLVARDVLAGFVARHRREPGVGILAGLLGQSGGPVFTRSPLEDRLGDEVREFGLPAPLFNVVVEGYELDAWWPDLRVAVELDGADYHRSWRSQQSDRRRDAHLTAVGITVIRVTWEQLVHDTKRTMTLIGQTLAIARERLERR